MHSCKARTPGYNCARSVQQRWNTWLVVHSGGRGKSCKERTPLVTIVHSMKQRKSSILSSSLSLTGHYHVTPLNCKEEHLVTIVHSMQQRKASIPSFSLSSLTPAPPPLIPVKLKGRHVMCIMYNCPSSEKQPIPPLLLIYKKIY